MNPPMLDPDVPVLREALTALQAEVAKKSITPKMANDTLGKLADSLVANRRKSSAPVSRAEARRRAHLLMQRN